MKNEYQVHGDVTWIWLMDRERTRYKALIDTLDLPLVSSHPNMWFVARRRNSIYAMGNRTRDGKCRSTLMHRLVLATDARLVDHINGNGLDNRRSNLRSANHSLNGLNSDRSCRTNPKGVRGVYPRNAKWVACIHVNGHNRYLGLFTTIEEAAAVRRRVQADVIRGLEAAT